MLNEPFGILDNIPLIWCFASFETYQSGGLEIATQKRGLTDAPQVFSVPAGLQARLPSRPFSYQSRSASTSSSASVFLTCALAQELSCAGLL